MCSYTLLSLFFWTLLSLVTAVPTEISLSENDAEEFVLENFNSTDGFIIPQPRYSQLNKNEKTYTVYFMEVNWFTAVVHCKYYGKVLATVTSLKDNQLLIQTLYEYGLGEFTTLWLGATNLGYNEQFVWISNGEPITFNNWRDGEPNNWNGISHCLEFSDGQWNAQNCLEKRKFVCESQ